MMGFIRRLIWTVLILGVLAAGILLWIRSSYHEPILALAQTQIMNTTSDLINDAIAKQMMDGDIHYDRIVYFEKDLDGRITALKTNISEINRLKTDTLNIINDEILAVDPSELGIPLGSLVLPEFLSGKGPAMPVEIISIRNSDASFTSTFTQAGINQTLHQINMSVIVDVVVLVLGQTESFTVGSEMVVSETIIVGEVPDTFLQNGGIYGTEGKNP